MPDAHEIHQFLPIQTGWQPGIVGWSIAHHAHYYAHNWGFGSSFEAKLAREMGSFLARLDQPGNHLFWLADAEGPIGTIAIDGDGIEDGKAHLRWFILDDRARGQGLGRRLLDAAVRAAHGDGATGIFLWTFEGLDPARRLYESAGFQLIDSRRARTWGREMTEQRFELSFREGIQ
ncbi:MAG: GNAT family N-acetyltransferase [Pseudomonadota bacterium]